MSRSPGRVRWLALALVVVLGFSSGVAWAVDLGPARKSVLLVFPHPIDLRTTEFAVTALRNEFAATSDLDCQLFFEFLDLNRFSEPSLLQHHFDLMASRYRGQPIDLVIVQSPQVLTLWLEQRSSLLPRVPVVFFDVSAEDPVLARCPPDVRGVVGNYDFSQSVRWLKGARPSIDTIVLVHGVGPADQRTLPYLDALRDDLGTLVRFQDISDRPLASMKETLAELPSTSAVLYYPLFQDAAGVKYQPIPVLKELAAVSSVPVLSGFDLFVGTGTVGGSMYSIAEQARNAAQIGKRLLRGGDPSTIPLISGEGNRFVFDHGALLKYHLDLSTLPPGALVENRQYSAWELYQTPIMATAAAFFVLVALVVLLVVATGRLRVARASLRQINQDLEATVLDRTKDLELAKEAAEKANLSKSRFLATISHEIRTPMTGVLGMAQMLLSEDPEPGLRKKYISTILNSGRTLLTLLNDVLDVSKIEARQVELERTPLVPGQILAETATLFSEQARSKGLRIEVVDELAAQDQYGADPLRLRQMVSNLVSNALKFTSEGAVAVRVVEVAREGAVATLEFSVTDTGIGIPADRLDRLFRPFSQVDASTSRVFGGTGLGLSIVQSMAELMGGRVGVESQIGQGSRFWFQISAEVTVVPVAPEHTDAVTTGGLPSVPTGRLVWVVEDNTVNQMIMASMLRQSDQRYEILGDGSEAVRRFDEGMRPDLILMDCQMPVLDGYQATKLIRQRERTLSGPSVPIVALSAASFPEEQLACTEAGMNDFLGKPIQHSSLMAILSKWLAPSIAGA